MEQEQFMYEYNCDAALGDYLERLKRSSETVERIVAIARRPSARSRSCTHDDDYTSFTSRQPLRAPAVNFGPPSATRATTL